MKAIRDPVEQGNAEDAAKNIRGNRMTLVRGQPVTARSPKEEEVSALRKWLRAKFRRSSRIVVI